MLAITLELWGRMCKVNIEQVNKCLCAGMCAYDVGISILLPFLPDMHVFMVTGGCECHG